MIVLSLYDSSWVISDDPAFGESGVWMVSLPLIFAVIWCVSRVYGQLRDSVAGTVIGRRRSLLLRMLIWCAKLLIWFCVMRQ